MGTMKGALRAMAALGALVAGSASAQLVAGIGVQPGTVKAGEQATVTVQFDVMSGTNCGLRVHWGDGTTGDFKINQAKDVPLVVQHAWPKPGTYTLKAEGKTVGITPKCGGRTHETTLVVNATAPAAAAARPAGNATMARTSPCPAGWALSKPGVGKNGGFTCTAKAGTAAPAQRPACPGDLTYFENTKRGQLGCRP